MSSELDKLRGVYLPQSTSQRRPKAGIARFDASVFGTDIEIPPRTAIFTGKSVRDATIREIKDVLEGYEHKPIDESDNFADTGPDGLSGQSPRNEKPKAHSRREQVGGRERGHRSPQYYTRGR